MKVGRIKWIDESEQPQDRALHFLGYSGEAFKSFPKNPYFFINAQGAYIFLNRDVLSSAIYYSAPLPSQIIFILALYN